MRETTLTKAQYCILEEALEIVLQTECGSVVQSTLAAFLDEAKVINNDDGE